MAHSYPSIGDHVSFSLPSIGFAHVANFGQVKGSLHGPSGMEYQITLPNGRMVEVNHKRVSPAPVLPEHTIGDMVTVASHEDDAPERCRLPKRFWIDVNPVKVMAIRLTAHGYVYLFEDIPLEYTRWVPEKYIAADLGSTADILSVLRDELDPAVYEQLRTKLAARKTEGALQDA